MTTPQPSQTLAHHHPSPRADFDEAVQQLVLLPDDAFENVDLARLRQEIPEIVLTRETG